jgi:phosphoesterase RecJ-like protein
MGKKANVCCSDEFPARYDFMYKDYVPQEFDEETVVAVDIADAKLIGKRLLHYGDHVDLCIDHHISNTDYAKRTLVEPGAAAACQVIYKLMSQEELAEPDEHIAACLYTGIATDTGCFRFDSTSPETHLAAAELMKCGINYGRINRRMFEQKSKARLKVEQYILESMEYYFNDKCAIASITLDEIAETGLPEGEFEGLAGLTTLLETVEIGIIIRQKEASRFKVSMRSTGNADVSSICQKFGGGGHVKAAGCTFECSLEEAKKQLVEAISEYGL